MNERFQLMKKRCEWAGDDPLYIEYHDLEWGVPIHNDAELFEMLILEGAQAGLSWITILRKRENYHQAFDGFDPGIIAEYDQARITDLLSNAGIVRNRRKIESTIGNARAFLEIQKAYGSFNDYLWEFVDGKPIQNAWKTLGDIPAQTEISLMLSKDLKKRGFRFVGPTICYAYMQSVGMVNDHVIYCFRYQTLGGEVKTQL